MTGLMREDTIVAVATAPLPAGVAVLRLSGPGAVEIAAQLAPALSKANPREMVYANLKYRGQSLDQALAVWFAQPHSFTGEDVVEFHCHGGRAVVQEVLSACYSLGARPAEAGEFSRRAVMNGKMDLTAAEGLADLINASTQEQHRQALRQLQGELGKRFEAWRQEIIALLAQVEAAIDFPDEELEVLEEAGLKTRLEKLLENLQQAVLTSAGQRLREGFEVTILGHPNSGKSTLTNMLSGKETAIVSPIAGTTRDVVEAHLDVAGYPIILADTAGVRETQDTIEAEGVKRARARADQADMVIIVVDGALEHKVPDDLTQGLRPGRSLVIFSKADIGKKAPETVEVAGTHYPTLCLNLTDAQSVTPILSALEGLLAETFAQAGDAAQITRERHRTAIYQTVEHLNRALELYISPPAEVSLADLLAQDLRDAAATIGAVTGRTDTETVLDEVFSTFCIGK